MNSKPSESVPADQKNVLPDFLRQCNDGTVLSVKVQPRASRNELGELMGRELKIRVTAAPVDAAANEAVVKLLAKTLDRPRGSVRLIRGATARHKTILVTGLPPAAVLEKLRRNR